MNNKILMAAIAVAATALVLVLIIMGVSAFDAEKNPNYVEPGFESELSEIPEDDLNDDDGDGRGTGTLPEGLGEPVIGKDDGFEGSDLPPSGSTSSENKEDSSSEENESEESSRPSSDSSSRPSSGSTSSGSSGSSSGSSSDSSSEDEEMTYKKYMEMSPEEQEAYMNSFESMEAFFEWYNAAKEKHEQEESENTVEGEINIGDYINP